MPGKGRCAIGELRDAASRRLDRNARLVICAAIGHDGDPGNWLALAKCRSVLVERVHVERRERDPAPPDMATSSARR